MSELPSHTPVMLRAVVELLRPARARCLLDCTVGLGGHAEALLSLAPATMSYIAIDRDAENLRRARERLRPFDAGGRVRFFQANFSQVRDVLEAANVQTVDGVLADLGFASTQVDDPSRGLSFAADGPLDMRMDREEGEQTAEDLVNTLGEEELANLIFQYGEERHSRRIARAIVAARKIKRIQRTLELAEIVSRALGGRHGQKIHPATRTFQDLRIAVNDELRSLEELLSRVPDFLASGGRAVIISFHSLEDRRVKNAFSAMESVGKGKIITPKPLVADDEEVQINSRSRSAKLRCIERI